MTWPLKNLQALDNFVLEHLSHERRCRNGKLEAEDTQVRMIRAYGEMRRLIMAGNLCDAVNIARTVCPEVLEDPRLMLKIHIHTLKEMTHKAHDGDESGSDYFGELESAVQFCRDILAPFALDAFPEAYNEFLSELKYLVFPELSRSEPLIFIDRQDIADILISTIKAVKGSFDSPLSLIVRYLALVDFNWKAHGLKNTIPSEMRRGKLRYKSGLRWENGTRPQDSEGEKENEEHSLDSGQLSSVGSSVADTLDQIISGKKEPKGQKAKPPSGASAIDEISNQLEVSSDNVERPPLRSLAGEQFQESEIQSLVHSLSISREDAINSLRHAEGDETRAFKCELARHKMNIELLNELAEEYCRCRGLDGENCLPKKQSDSVGCEVLKNLRSIGKLQGVEEVIKTATELCPSLLEQFPRLSFQISQFKFAEQLKARNYEAALEIARTELAPMAANDSELLSYLKQSTLLLAFPEISSSYCSIAPSGQLTVDKGADGLPPGVVHMMMKATGENSAVKTNEHSTGQHQQEEKDRGNIVMESMEVEGIGNGEQNAEPMEIEPKVRTSTQTDANVLSEAIYSAVAKSLNIEEPRLIQLLSRLLESHHDWSAQSMMTDVYALKLGVSDLTTDYQEADSAVIMGNQEAVATEKNMEFDEEKVSTLMAVLSIVRAEAIELIRRHGGRDAQVQEIIEAKFG
eukprot:Plantae.Rhodophyta-Hildenbrandia_rubra.ctg5798.p1 GENE.Plantae.Rhodophyta-Hildenbrandia_rubra.ctg5798~~Plantae.Rhodophyta-Hildenbrandia_rubra.ctg5798.p1  ORF type:complete len:690 (+),score=122.03 Plantae.Rhodophyta-Hildenbrandia_rubra.ctg5798:1868-3937(+)